MLAVVHAFMAEPASPRKLPWLLTLAGLLAIAALAYMPVLAGEPGARDMPDWFRFFGHTHPLLLHLPIGVFLLIVLQELGAMFFRRGQRDTALFPMFFGAASAVAAALAGFLLYHGHGGDYGGDEVAERHLWVGLAFAGAAVLTFLAKAWTVALDGNPAWFRLLLFGSAGVMTFASHDGATLTHGSGYLTQHAPDPVRKLLGLEARPARQAARTPEFDPVVYVDLVAPVFERRCVSCHKPGKAKGKLRMDTYEMLLKGGGEGPSLVPGSVEDSLLVEFIELPEDDEYHMPPEGKPDIEPAELAVVKWWIESGADPAKKLSEHEVPEEIRAAIASLGAFSAPADPQPEEPAPADRQLQQWVDELAKEFPGAVAFDPQDPPRVRFDAVPLRGDIDDDRFSKISPLIPHLVSVDLSASKVTDRSIALLAAAKNLRLLRMAETPITDAAIDTIVKLPALESVNFYGTAVTDEGVLKLAALPGLKHIYLWQTKVSPETIATLKQRLPACEIVTGS